MVVNIYIVTMIMKFEFANLTLTSDVMMFMIQLARSVPRIAS